MGIRQGPSVIPVVTQAATANTTPGFYTFKPGRVPCMLTNNTGQTIHVVINKHEADIDVTDTFNIIIVNGASFDLSFGGLVVVSRVTIWFPTSATEAYIGWFAPKQ